MKPQRYSEYEDAYLRSHYDGHNVTEVAAALGRTVASVRARLSALMVEVVRHAWTDTQDAYLWKARREGKTFSEIADEMCELFDVCRSDDSVRMHWNKLNLHGN